MSQSSHSSTNNPAPHVCSRHHTSQPDFIPLVAHNYLHSPTAHYISFCSTRTLCQISSFVAWLFSVFSHPDLPLPTSFCPWPAPSAPQPWSPVLPPSQTIRLQLRPGRLTCLLLSTIAPVTDPADRPPSVPDLLQINLCDIWLCYEWVLPSLHDRRWRWDTGLTARKRSAEESSNIVKEAFNKAKPASEKVYFILLFFFQFVIICLVLDLQKKIVICILHSLLVYICWYIFNG